MTIIAILMPLVVVVTIGTECIRRIVDRRLLEHLLVDIERSVDDLYFVIWDELRVRYGVIGKALTGISGWELLPLEAYTALKSAERKIAASDPEAKDKLAVIRNALETLPTTFDCYKCYGMGRALIAAFLGLLIISDQLNQYIGIAILAIIFLTAVPATAMTGLTWFRMLSSTVTPRL